MGGPKNLIFFGSSCALRSKSSALGLILWNEMFFTWADEVSFPHLL